MMAYVLGTAFTLWMAVECVRRGQASPWLFVILVFPAIGAAVYFFAEVLGPRARKARKGAEVAPDQTQVALRMRTVASSSGARSPKRRTSERMASAISAADLC